MSLITIPKKIYIVASDAEGSTPINAFDACLVKAGLPQVSLVKVTSILPREVEIIKHPPRLPDGANVPAIYTYTTSDIVNDLISAAIVVAFTDGVTLVAEYSGRTSRREAENYAKAIAEEMARMRELSITKIIIRSASHKVRKVGCVLALVAEVG